MCERIPAAHTEDWQPYERPHMLSTIREDFTPGYTLFAFNLSPDQQHAVHYSLIKTKDMRAETHFAGALTTTVNMVPDSIFGNVIEINHRRYVPFD